MKPLRSRDGVCRGVALCLFVSATACGNDGGTPSSAGGDCEPADAGEPETGPLPEPGECPQAILSEDFESFPEGAPLADSWSLVVEGPYSTARLNLDAEGHGNVGSNRFALFTNGGSDPDPVEISATTPAVDVRTCAGVVLTASVAVFSLEQAENDHAFVEVRGNGGDWIPMYMPFPSPDFPSDANCRVGGQETGCTAFKTVTIDVPRVALGPALEVRFRTVTLTSVTDFFGFDDVALTGVAP